MTPRLTAILCVAFLIAMVGQAAAAPGDLAARTETWMERTLGVELPARPLVAADISTCGGVATDIGGCEAVAFGDRIEVGPETWRDIEVVERTGIDRYRRGQLLLHELLHDDHAAWTPTDLEEGIVEAVSQDLYAAWGKAMGLREWSRADVNTSSYPAQLAAVRKASALATGVPWKSRAARLWRRDLWRADAVTRVEMYEAAWG